jgi:hypothetical protein
MLGNDPQIGKEMISSIKVLVCFVLLATISNIAAASKEVQSADDHLIPLEGWLEPAYKEVLTRNLFVTPANYARIVKFPPLPSLGEISVAIYSAANDSEAIFLTLTRGERNFWSAEFGSDPTFPKGVKVARCDVRFPKSVAESVQAAFKRQLDKSRPLRNPDNTIILDANIIEFSIDEPQRGRVAAYLSPYAIGKTGKALRKFSQLLIDYCDAGPTKRAALAKRIEAEARRLK